VGRFGERPQMGTKDLSEKKGESKIPPVEHEQI